MSASGLISERTAHSLGLARLADLNTSGGITAVVAGVGVAVNSITNPQQPVVSTNLVAGANITFTQPVSPSTALTISAVVPEAVLSVVAGTNIGVDNTDPLNPVVSYTGPSGGGGITAVIAGTDISVDNTNPAQPVVSYTGGSGGGITSVIGGTGITIDNTNPSTPIISGLLTQYALVSEQDNCTPPSGSVGPVNLTAQQAIQVLNWSPTALYAGSYLLQVYVSMEGVMTTSGGNDLLQLTTITEINSSGVAQVSSQNARVYVDTLNKPFGVSSCIITTPVSLIVGANTLDIKITAQSMITGDDYTFNVDCAYAVLTRIAPK